MVDLLIYLAIIVIVVLVAWYVLTQVPLPGPIKQIITIVLVVVVAIVAIGVLMGLRGHSFMLH